MTTPAWGRHSCLPSAAQNSLNYVRNKKTTCAALVVVFAFLISSAALAQDAKHYQARGVILKIDHAQNSAYISTDAIPGFMEAMAMSYPAKNPKVLDSLAPGTIIDFT